MADPVAIGMDIGGTKLVAARVAADGTFEDRRRLATPAGDEAELIETIISLVDALTPEDGTRLPVGLGIAAIVDRAGVAVYGPNIGARELPIARILADELGVHVAVGNDANVAAYAEAKVGAGAGHDDVVMITLGTGVGGGIVVDGRLVVGASGYGGELGHIIVEEGGRPCPCGNTGCLEAYTSGTAFAAIAAERLRADGEGSSLHLADVLDGKAVTQAALAGDDLALGVLREAAGWLGVGLASVVNALDPAVVVIGGGAAIEPADILLPVAREAMARRLMGRAHREPPRVELAALGDDAGLVGAALLAAKVGTAS